jgi:hypothetical protein
VSRFLSATPVLALFSGFLLQASVVMAQQSEPFTAACMTKKNATALKCACQSKLARASLDTREQQVALSGLRGDKAGFEKQVKAMKPESARILFAKMDKLGVQSRSECR